MKKPSGTKTNDALLKLEQAIEELESAAAQESIDDDDMDWLEQLIARVEKVG